MGWGLPPRVSPAAGQPVRKLGLDGLGMASHVRCLSGYFLGPLTSLLHGHSSQLVQVWSNCDLMAGSSAKGQAPVCNCFSNLCLHRACRCSISHSKPQDQVSNRCGLGLPKDAGAMRGTVMPCYNLRHILIPKMLKYEKYASQNTLTIIAYYI